MRPVFLFLCAFAGTLGAAVQASPVATDWALFKSDSKGCLAANTGALDLHLKLKRSNTPEGQIGSGLVSGFQQGDVLQITRTSGRGQRGLSYYLSELDHQQIATVLSWADANTPVRDDVEFVIPAEGSQWALFSSVSADEGEGEFAITVRCIPREDGHPTPTS